MTTELKPIGFPQILLLAFAPAIGLGLGRFAYALLLPAMKEELQWSYADAGWMNTANGIGYLFGALITASLAARIGLLRLTRIGVVGASAALLASGWVSDFTLFSVLRFVPGVMGAFCLVGGGTLAALVLSDNSRRSQTGLAIFYVGPGIGIAISGLLIPTFMQHFGNSAWPMAWLAVAVIALVLATAFLMGFKQDVTTSPLTRIDARPVSIGSLASVLIGYAAFGAGYIGYMTFMFAYLSESGASAALLSLFWVTIGLSAMAAPWVWSKVSTPAHYARGIAFFMAITLIGAAMPLIGTERSLLFVSAAIFGLAFFSATGATTAYAKQHTRQSEWPRVIGFFTTAFGLGQVLGPYLLGAISDAAGELSVGLACGCVLLLIGVIACFFQRSLDSENR